jgi:hypothetical protein
MKTLIYLFAIVMLIFAGCAKDEMFDENSNNLELKKAKVPIPMKAEFCMNPNMEAGFILIEGLDPANPQSYLPKEGWISGHATHMGKIIMEESPTTFVYAAVTPMGVKTISEGKITAANGDNYLFKATSYSFPDKSFTGEVYMYNGTGKFEGMTGTVIMTGSGSCWSAEGTMSYKK